MDQSAESTRLPNDRDGPRMVKLQQAFHTALKRAIAKSMTEDEFVSCFSGLSDSQIDLMRQIYPQLFENLEDAATREFETIVDEKGVRKSLNKLDASLLKANKDDAKSGSQSADPHELVERARLTQLKVDLLNTKQALKEAKEEKAKYEQDLTVLRRRNEAGEALLVAQLKEIRESTAAVATWQQSEAGKWAAK